MKVGHQKEQSVEWADHGQGQDQVDDGNHLGAGDYVAEAAAAAGDVAHFGSTEAYLGLVVVELKLNRRMN